MNRRQGTAATACMFLSAFAVPVAPWAVLPLGIALLTAWDYL